MKAETKESLSFYAVCGVVIVWFVSGYATGYIVGARQQRLFDSASICPDVPPTAPQPVPVKTIQTCMWTEPGARAADGGASTFEVPCDFFWSEVERQKRESTPVE